MKQILRASLLFITGFFIQTLQINANNISVSGISITGKNTTAGVNNAANYSLVKFNIAWENSWRSSALNWDAAWVFVKYRVNGGAWNHCNLNNTGHTAPTGSTIDAGLVAPSSTFNAITNPAVGVFIYKNADGNGNVNYQNVQLRWNYGSQGVADNAILDVQVFAIEMVYVPTGTFAVGDGGTNANQFSLTTINTGNATTAPSGIGSLGGQAGGYPTEQTAPTSSSWPNGYNAFYSMKYELTVGQYRDFLNTLTYTQQTSKCSLDIVTVGNFVNPYIPDYWRNKLKVKTAGVVNTVPAIFGCDLNDNGVYDESSDGEFIAIANINWADFGSFLDWSGLRPITEMEFEKACRGNQTPISGEYAWGTSSIFVAEHDLSNSGYANEAISSNYSTTLNQGNAAYAYGVGPLRVGIFASNSNNLGRVTSGSSFYGIMELSGNAGELAINLYLGRSFTGDHGNGILQSDGLYNVSNWPSSNSGIGSRGGYFTDSQHLLEVSNRSYVDSNVGSSRNGGFAGRGVRSAQ